MDEILIAIESEHLRMTEQGLKLAITKIPHRIKRGLKFKEYSWYGEYFRDDKRILVIKIAYAA